MTQHGAQPWAGQYGSVHSVPSLDRLGGRGGGGGGGHWGRLIRDLLQSLLWKVIESSSGIDGDVHSLTLSIKNFLC